MANLRNASIVPHAPLLVPGVSGSSELEGLEEVRAATRAVARAWSPTTVLISPHGSRPGVYTSPRADLAFLGVPRADARYTVDTRGAEALRARWQRPHLDEPCDHGITVPLLLCEPADPLVAVTMGEGDDPGEALALADAIRALDGDVTVVASANTGAGITARAPLTELPGARALEEELRAVVERDLGDLVELAPRLGSEAGSCAVGPLLVLGHLFAGRAARVLAHSWPVGVGYLVAGTEPS